MEKHFWDNLLVFFLHSSIGQLWVSARFCPMIIWALFVICSLNPDIKIKKLLLAISYFVFSHIFFTGQDILKAYLCALLQSCFMGHNIWEESNSKRLWSYFARVVFKSKTPFLRSLMRTKDAHGTRYFGDVPMCFATVLLYGSYYMRGIRFILFFPEGS